MEIISYEQEADQVKYMYLMHWNSMKRSNYRFHNSHIHRAIEIVICEEGEMSFKSADRVGSISNSQILIFNSYDRHYYEYIKEFKGYILVLSVDFVNDILPSGAFEFNNVISPSQEDWLQLSQILKKLFKTYTNMSFLFRKAHIIMFFDILSKYNLIRDKKSVTLKDISTQIFEYIEEYYSTNITLISISKAFGYTPTYFSTLFSSIIGEELTFKSYLNLYRLKKVYELKNTPQYSHEPQKSLIKRCGFTSMDSFYRAEKKYKNRLK